MAQHRVSQIIRGIGRVAWRSMRTRRRSRKCWQQWLPNRALLSAETGQVLALACLSLPLNLYAANFDVAANLMGVQGTLDSSRRNFPPQALPTPRGRRRIVPSPEGRWGRG